MKLKLAYDSLCLSPSGYINIHLQEEKLSSQLSTTIPVTPVLLRLYIWRWVEYKGRRGGLPKKNWLICSDIENVYVYHPELMLVRKWRQKYVKKSTNSAQRISAKRFSFRRIYFQKLVAQKRNEKNILIDTIHMFPDLTALWKFSWPDINLQTWISSGVRYHRSSVGLACALHFCEWFFCDCEVQEIVRVFRILRSKRHNSPMMARLWDTKKFTKTQIPAPQQILFLHELISQRFHSKRGLIRSSENKFLEPKTVQCSHLL